MNLDQSIGQYLRLKQELALAYSVLPWNDGRINRLTVDLACAEHAIRIARVSGDQCAAERSSAPALSLAGHY